MDTAFSEHTTREEDTEERNMAGPLEMLLSHATTAADNSTAPSETSPAKV